MSVQPAEMLDAVFDVAGDTLPPNYAFALWDSLLGLAPWLADDLSVGVVPLRTSANAEGLLLSRRAKLALRLPQALAEQAASLCGQQLVMGGSTLQLGKLKLRALQAYPTLHAHLVSADADEAEFMQEVSARLAELEIVAKLICGIRQQLVQGERVINGYSLVIHDLKPEASLRLQYRGLGAERSLGCGIFVPYKAITDLD